MSPQKPVKPLKFDFHMHTLDDPKDQHVYHTAFELIDKASGMGYDALAITLHTRQFESQTAIAYALDRGILLVPGVEQDVEGSHVLLINFPKAAAEAVRSFEDIRRLREQASRSSASTLVVAPHPFFPSGVALKEKFWRHRELFDAIEVSGFYHAKWNPNLKALQAAEKLGLPLIGNSDTHTLEQFGKTWTEADCEPTVEGIIQAVKEGRTVIKGRSLAAVEMGRITWQVVAKGYMKWINYKRKRGYTPAA